jgi:hypothetical protein
MLMQMWLKPLQLLVGIAAAQASSNDYRHPSLRVDSGNYGPALEEVHYCTKYTSIDLLGL